MHMRLRGYVIISVPLQILGKGLINHFSNLTGANGHMVFKTVFTYVVKKSLETRNLNHTITAKGMQGVIGDLPFPDISPDLTLKVIRGNPAVSGISRLNPSHQCSVGILFAHSSGDNRLIVHDRFMPENILRQIATVKDYAFVWIITVVVIPIQQSAGTSGGQH